MSSEELFALIALATVGTFTPGPNTALSATIAANHSLRHWLRAPNGTARRLQWFNRLMALALLGTIVWMMQSALAHG